MNPASRPDYGIDAPSVVRNLLVIGVALMGLGVFVNVVHLGDTVIDVRTSAWITGPICVVQGLVMLAYSKVGKLRYRERMLNRVAWTGREAVLDVGTGRGLLLVGAAKRLTAGRATGIDVWSAKDLSSNDPDGARQNATIEGVADRIDVQNGDATAMAFPDRSFDLVVSNLCLHNIPGRAARDRACREIVRVLKPGGRALISDYRFTADYAKAFRSAGAEAKRTAPDPLTFPPLRVVAVRKP